MFQSQRFFILFFCFSTKIIKQNKKNILRCFRGEGEKKAQKNKLWTSRKCAVWKRKREREMLKKSTTHFNSRRAFNFLFLVPSCASKTHNKASQNNKTISYTRLADNNEQTNKRQRQTTKRFGVYFVLLFLSLKNHLQVSSIVLCAFA